MPLSIKRRQEEEHILLPALPGKHECFCVHTYADVFLQRKPSHVSFSASLCHETLTMRERPRKPGNFLITPTESKMERSLIHAAHFLTTNTLSQLRLRTIPVIIAPNTYALETIGETYTIRRVNVGLPYPASSLFHHKPTPSPPSS
jgi:hypothetical protein